MAQPLVKKDDDQDDEGQFPSLKYPCNLNFSPEISICNLALLWIREPAGSRDNSPFGLMLIDLDLDLLVSDLELWN